MECSPAKEILARWRPGLPVTTEPEIDEALASASADPGLSTWLRRHSDFQTGTTQALRNLEVPDDLAAHILLQHRIDRPAFRRPVPWSLAAAAACLLAVAAGIVFAFVQSGTDSGNDLATFRRRMVRAALREYRMDITTNNLAAIRAHLAKSSAPADFELPPGLAQLPPVGGGSLSWQHQQTAMICLDAGKDGMLFLFVADRSGIESPPLPATEWTRVSRLSTGTWAHQGKIYVLASSAGLETLRKYL